MLTKGKFPAIKVVSDGTRAGTKILDPETGKGLDSLRCIGVTWEVPDGKGQPILTLRCQASEIEIESEDPTIETL